MGLAARIVPSLVRRVGLALTVPVLATVVTSSCANNGLWTVVLRIKTQGIGGGTVTADEPEANPNCSVHGTELLSTTICEKTFLDINGHGIFKLYADPDDGQEFQSWEGHCTPLSTGPNPPCEVVFSPSSFPPGDPVLVLDVWVNFSPPLGTVRIATTTDPPGYPTHDMGLRILRATLPAMAAREKSTLVAVPPNGTTDVELADGAWIYELEPGAASTCALDQLTQSQFHYSFAGALHSTPVHIVCTPPNAAFAVQTTTSGLQPDPDGYEVVLDDVTLGPMGLGENRNFMAAAGTHTLRLEGVAPGCSVTSPNPVVFTLLENGSENVPFAVHCPFDPTGTWTFGYVVKDGTGVCEGTEGVPSESVITITRSGDDYPYLVTARGFLGSLNNVLVGTQLTETQLTLAGSYPEDGGTTTASYQLTASTAQLMEGPEAWSWTSPASGSCPNSESTVTAVR
jgi:hypothetical protein